MKEVQENGNIVAEYLQGNVRVEIFNNAYTGKTEKDIDGVLKRIADIGWRIINEIEEKD